MKLVTYNIQYTMGRDGRFDVERIAESVRSADIIALQEVVRNFEGTNWSDQAAEIGALLPNYYWAFGIETDTDASAMDANGRVVNRRRQWGNMLLSRWPILSARAHLLPFMGSASHDNAQCGALEGVIDTDHGLLRVYSLHLSYLSERERLRQIDWLIDLNRRVWLEGGVSNFPSGRLQYATATPMPFDAIYLGDFNLDPIHSKDQYERLVGPLDPDYGRVHYRDLLVDAWVAAGNEEGTGNTYPASDRYPKPPDRWYLDYCFVTPTLADKVKRAWIDNEAQGSDHQPVWFELEF